MRRLGVDSLPIALFLASFTGIVLALQASYTFTGAIPLYFVGVLVGKTMILELGPVLTGLALSGRVGANIAAQLGTMRVSEQIDALETLAYNPVSYLVVPRVLAGTADVPHRRDLRQRARDRRRAGSRRSTCSTCRRRSSSAGCGSSTNRSTSPTR
jgi:phospholipid/cholesterol/gamma-HCH transport system permease protein